MSVNCYFYVVYGYYFNAVEYEYEALEKKAEAAGLELITIDVMGPSSPVIVGEELVHYRDWDEGDYATEEEEIRIGPSWALIEKCNLFGIGLNKAPQLYAFTQYG
jgi:hypothetical protein